MVGEIVSGKTIVGRVTMVTGDNVSDCGVYDDKMVGIAVLGVLV